MSLTTVEFTDFQGLDLRTASDEGQGALDLLNVDLDRPGYLRSRSGYAKFTASAAAGRFDLIGMHAGFPVAHATDNKLRAFDGSGNVIATSGTLFGAVGSFPASLINFGTPGTTASYYSYGSAQNRLTRFDGATFTDVVPTTTGTGVSFKGGALGYTPWDNRLIVAYDSTVLFSDPGAPESFNLSNYLYLTPGDGEGIGNIVVWREFVFVFKLTKFFVFYGTGTAADGTPEFQYRTVSMKTGAANPIGGYAAGDDGVYFARPDGIYVTNGGQPRKISHELDPLFNVVPLTSYYQGSKLNRNRTYEPSMMCWFKGRLYWAAAVEGSSVNSILFMWDPAAGWFVWDIPAADLATDGEGLYFAYASGTNDIGVYGIDLTRTTDAGNAITSRYRSRFFDFGIPNEKTIRESVAWGTGTATLKIARDYGNLDTGSTLSFGVSNSQARRRTAVRGTVFSHQIGGTSAWTLQRLQHNVRSRRPPGVHTT